MSAFSKIDMAEVTRLTRAGKLMQAMALLRGEANAGTDAPGAASSTMGATPFIDMVAPSLPGGSWTAPRDRSTKEVFRAGGALRLSDLPQNLPGTRLLKSHSLPGGSFGFGFGREPDVSVPPDARFEERLFSNHIGSRTYKIYVPSGYTGQPLPLVVMLHGCTQNPDDFAAGTRMNELAEEEKFLVAYPCQSQAANMQKCWNWFNAKDQQREGGEPSLIAGIARQVIEEFSVDTSRIYVAGLSAGGAAAAVLATTYPDLFAAVGIHSGLACGAARDMASAFAAMSGHGAPPRRSEGQPVPTIIFHGDADQTVNPVNADHLVSQMKAEAALTEIVTRGQTPGGMAYTRTVHRGAAGTDIVENWILHGAGHAWAGGGASGSYTDPKGPDASREMIRFFLTHTSTRQGED
jgi:poly(hydroxyalkanoate) depolymerase family esterase